MFDIEIEITQTIIRDTGQLYVSTEQARSLSPLTWSGTTKDLIELIYALHYCKCLNNGNIRISDIAVFFEKVFNIQLGRYYLKFTQIRARKKDRTVFLHKLCDCLTESIERLDA